MSLSNQFIFILGTAKFDNPYESASYIIAKNLAKTNKVFYIENPFTWKDYFKQKGTQEFIRRRKHFSLKSDGLLSTELPGLKVVITPPLLSINFFPEGLIYRQLLKINEINIARRIRNILIKEKIDKYIYINSFNFHYPEVSRYISPELTVYHCVDPLILPFDKRHGLTSEPKLLKNSDVVICTSKQLYEEKKQVNPNTFFVPNAADISHSNKAMDQDLAIHKSIEGLKKPVIGFFGHIERRMDFDLIKDITTNNPHKSFVFAGPISAEFVPEWFFNTPNIFTTGQLPYDQLPGVLKGFDITLIPFKKDAVSATIFPLKLFEYLGAGKPVIATNFNPDLEEFTKGTVRFCDDNKSFSAAISEELTTNSEEKINKRLKIAEENTWIKRVEEFSEILRANLETAS
ncbi:glycosyltransferase [Paradesertivirga mongoliensis]|uniref:Glycosyltransferase n=1 Tax=Paradesertivirga mongoliensis TaxID=2100740 RepID=A0ABW4ZM15_9SPHI|nr:glycosyltransferase [Pedobacter mongoliensis]